MASVCESESAAFLKYSDSSILGGLGGGVLILTLAAPKDAGLFS